MEGTTPCTDPLLHCGDMLSFLVGLFVRETVKPATQPDSVSESLIKECETMLFLFYPFHYVMQRFFIWPKINVFIWAEYYL